MDRFVQYFFEGSEQFIVLGSVFALWIGLTVLGGVVGGRDRVSEGDPLFGWAAVSILVTAFGTLFSVSFTVIGMGLAVLVAIAAFVLFRRRERLFGPGYFATMLLALPLLLQASAMVASQWDEFSHWVPTIRFLLEADGFPHAGNPETGGAFPGYPYGWSILSYFACRLAGRFLENPGSLLNVLLLIAFGRVAMRLLLEGAGREDTTRMGWGLCAGAILAGTLFNPTFAQKVALTAYADVSSAVATAFGAVLGWTLLNALAEGNGEKARRLAWQFGLVMLVLVNVKQANLVLFVMLLGGIGVAGLRDPLVRLGALVRLLPLMVFPAVLIYGLWRYHVVTQLSPEDEAVFREFALWNFDLIPQILQRMLLVASKKGVYFGLMAVAVVFAIRGLVQCKGRFDRLAIVVGTAFLGYNAFLFFIYLAHHGEFNAVNVVSYWRYNMHIGLLSVVFAAYGLGLMWRRYGAGRAVPRAVGWLPVVIILAAPLVFAHKIRFDLEPPKPHFRAVAMNLPEVLPVGSRMFILDPRGSGESGLITKYHLGPRFREFIGYFAAFHPFDAESVRLMITTEKPSHILVHSTVPALHEGVGMELPDDASHLLERNDGERWTVVHSWPYPNSR